MIVTGSATSVDALGGDDLVCVATVGAPHANVIDVDAGAGDDVVDTTATGGGYYVETTLGAGTTPSSAAAPATPSGPATGRRRPGTDTDADRIDTGTAATAC